MVRCKRFPPLSLLFCTLTCQCLLPASGDGIATSSSFGRCLSDGRTGKDNPILSQSFFDDPMELTGCTVLNLGSGEETCVGGPLGEGEQTPPTEACCGCGGGTRTGAGAAAPASPAQSCTLSALTDMTSRLCPAAARGAIVPGSCPAGCAAAFAPFASRCGIREGGRFPGLTPALVDQLAAFATLCAGSGGDRGSGH